MSTISYIHNIWQVKKERVPFFRNEIGILKFTCVLHMTKHSYKKMLVCLAMQRVPTWANSPYVGMFQYNEAGPDRIHKRLTPFFLPPSPYLGALRHDKIVTASVPKTQSVGTQTDICLSAYVIDNYSSERTF